MRVLLAQGFDEMRRRLAEAGIDLSLKIPWRHHRTCREGFDAHRLRQVRLGPADQLGEIVIRFFESGNHAAELRPIAGPPRLQHETLASWRTCPAMGGPSRRSRSWTLEPSATGRVSCRPPAGCGVASEVRTLAHRSAAAAKETKGRIEDAAAQVGAGAALVEEAAEATDSLQQQADQLVALVDGSVPRIAGSGARSRLAGLGRRGLGAPAEPDQYPKRCIGFPDANNR